MLRRKIEALGVKVHTSKATEIIEASDHGNTRLLMKFADGGSLATDMIVFSARYSTFRSTSSRLWFSGG